jgi:DNA polymerase-3 subunit delta
MHSLSYWEEKLRSDFKPVYLFLGEKPLVMPLIKNLSGALLPDDESREFNIETFEGEFAIEEVLRSISLKSFGGMRKIILLKEPFFLTDTDKGQGENKETKDTARFIQRLGKLKNPNDVVIIIQLETLDSRKKISKAILELSEVIDLRIDKGDAKNKRNFVISFCNEILTKNQKKIRNDVLNYFIDQVGEDDLVAIQNELEKLINFTPDKEIKKEDIAKVVSHEREEQVYELTQAIGEKNLKKSLVSLKNLISQQIQPIIIAGTIFNFIKRILSIKQIIRDKNINKNRYDIFKKDSFPEIKAILDKNPTDIFENIHPYALFILVKNSFNFSEKNLLRLYDNFCNIDLALKGSPIKHEVILEHFIIKIISEDEVNPNGQ